MQFITLLAVATPFIAGVSAKCQIGGMGYYSWPKGKGDADAVAAVPSACTEMLGQGAFKEDTTRYACRPLSGDKSASMRIQWRGKGTASLAHADCVKRITNEITGCENGGGTTTSDWFFATYAQTAKCT